MKKHFYTALWIICIGFFMASGMKLSEWVFRDPPTRLTICFSDSDGLLGECKPFEDYISSKINQ